MKKIIVDNCKACDPINKLIEDLVQNGFEILDSKLEDYHFHQLYFKIKGNIHEIEKISKNNFSQINNFLICDCHWSRIEFIDK